MANTNTGGSMKHSILATFFTVCFVSCASTKGFEETKVLERIAGEDETPKWTAAKKVVDSDDKKFYFVHAINTSNRRPEVCMKIAEEGARGNLLRYIKDNLTHSGQSGEAGENDPTYESLTTWLATGKVHGITVEDRYWEKVLETVAIGQQEIKIRCAAKIGITKNLLEKQIREAAGQEGNETIRKAQEKAIETFIANTQKDSSSKEE